MHVISGGWGWDASVAVLFYTVSSTFPSSPLLWPLTNVYIRHGLIIARRACQRPRIPRLPRNSQRLPQWYRVRSEDPLPSCIAHVHSLRARRVSCFPVFKLTVAFSTLIVCAFSWKTRARVIFKLTAQHAIGLAKFVTLYKTLLLVQKKLHGGKSNSADTFFAGLAGGICCVW